MYLSDDILSIKMCNSKSISLLSSNMWESHLYSWYICYKTDEKKNKLISASNENQTMV